MTCSACWTSSGSSWCRSTNSKSMTSCHSEQCCPAQTAYRQPASSNDFASSERSDADSRPSWSQIRQGKKPSEYGDLKSAGRSIATARYLFPSWSANKYIPPHTRVTLSTSHPVSFRFNLHRRATGSIQLGPLVQEGAQEPRRSSEVRSGKPLEGIGQVHQATRCS